MKSYVTYIHGYISGTPKGLAVHSSRLKAHMIVKHATRKGMGIVFYFLSFIFLVSVIVYG